MVVPIPATWMWEFHYILSGIEPVIVGFTSVCFAAIA